MAAATLRAQGAIALGHGRIGLITGPAGGSASADRLAGYHSAMLAAGLPLVPELVRESDFTIDGGYRAALDLLSLPARPTAIFALNDNMAVGVLRAARDRSLEVPRDLAVVGFDDGSWRACPHKAKALGLARLKARHPSP